MKRYSKNFHTLIEANEENIVECDRCKRFLLSDDPPCQCIGDDLKATRVDGVFQLMRVTKNNQILRLYFQNTLGFALCNCIFLNKRNSGLEFIESKDYNLIGWQANENRFNTIHIDNV